MNVNDINEEPSSISTSADKFNPNIDKNLPIATLTSNDEDIADIHTYSLVRGEGDSDNISFTIDGDELFFRGFPFFGDQNGDPIFILEDKNTYSIRLQSVDSGGLTHEEIFTLNVSKTPRPTEVNIDEGTKTFLRQGRTTRLPLGGCLSCLGCTDRAHRLIQRAPRHM